MDRERRKGDIPIPENLEEILNKAQRKALPGIKFSGWEPWFLRQEMFKDPVLGMRNSNDGEIAILDEDGRLRTEDDANVREEDRNSQAPPENKVRYFG
jgi:hypothetical protein